MSHRPKLYLFDSFALIFRAYFAMSKTPLINSKGINVSAISGFTNNIFDILNQQKPDYIACAFDAAAQTDRQAAFEFYKANRQETPEDIKTSIPYIKSIIKGFNIPILEVDGYEADDLIGTIAKQAEAEGVDVYMVTPDKDMCQLVSEHIFVYKPPYMGRPYEILDYKTVCEKWEVDDPIQVIDILGLMGDASDNIPGIKGVGEKTAKSLIKEFGSVEKILDNAHTLKGALKDKVESGKEMAIISKQLATIHLGAPVQFDHELFSVKTPDKEVLSPIFADLEFRTLGKRILGETYNVLQKPVATPGQMSLFDAPAQEIAPTEEESGEKNIHNTPHEYHQITSVEALQKIIADAYKAGFISIDTETTGLDANQCRMLGISLSAAAHTGAYLPWMPLDNAMQPYIDVLQPLLLDPKVLKIGQNIKYDLLVLTRHGLEIDGPIFDTMVAHYVAEPDGRHSMDYLSETLLGYKPVSIESLIGKKGVKQKNMEDVEISEVTDYASEDADITLQLYQNILPILENDEVLEVYKNIEAPLIPVLADMEKEGVKVNTEFLSLYSKELEKDILSLRQEVFEIAGTEFNLDSPKQLGDVLFEVMKIPYVEKKTKTGQYSTAEETLQKLAGAHPIINHILDYRELTKLKSTYVDAIPGLINPNTGRVHTTFNQAVASTGRLSSTNPNLQNIPIRTDKGRRIRAAFVARDEDHILLSADYSQVELRIVASLSKDPKMIEAFRNKVDIHTATAANVYGVALQDVTSDMRRNAKMVNFGIIYGISAFGLAQRLGIPRGEAAALIDNYFKQYPGVKSYMDQSIQNAKQHGYTKTLLGRKRYLRDINSGNATIRGFAERNAINAPIQGTAADMIKIAMIDIAAKMKKEQFQSKMILQVHDELLFDVYKPELERLSPLVESCMENAIEMLVPLEVGIGTGNNWLEAH